MENRRAVLIEDCQRSDIASRQGLSSRVQHASTDDASCHQRQAELLCRLRPIYIHFNSWVCVYRSTASTYIETATTTARRYAYFITANVPRRVEPLSFPVDAVASCRQAADFESAQLISDHADCFERRSSRGFAFDADLNILYGSARGGFNNHAGDAAIPNGRALNHDECESNPQCPRFHLLSCLVRISGTCSSRVAPEVTFMAMPRDS